MEAVEQYVHKLPRAFVSPGSNLGIGEGRKPQLKKEILWLTSSISAASLPAIPIHAGAQGAAASCLTINQEFAHKPEMSFPEGYPRETATHAHTNIHTGVFTVESLLTARVGKTRMSIKREYHLYAERSEVLA